MLISRAVTVLSAMTLAAVSGCGLVSGLGDLVRAEEVEGGATDAAPDSPVSVDAGSGVDAEAGACDPGQADPTLLSDVIALAAGRSFMCALRTNGTVACWGQNDRGQLAITSVDRSSPSTIPTLTAITAITAGIDFACALDKAKEVWCWGDNAFGQLGTGAADAVPHLPAKVTFGATSTLGSVTALAAGGRHVCVIAGGAVTCWGANEYGQLGGAGVGVAPVAVTPAFTNPIEIAGGDDYSCAVADSSDPTSPRVASCWGRDNLFQLGNSIGDTSTPQKIGVVLATRSSYPLAAPGHGHVCVRDSANHLSCWGENDFGQLGPTATVGTNDPAPHVIEALGEIKMAAAGDDFTCAIRTDGTVMCLGLNDASQLGNGSRDVGIDGGLPPANPIPTLVSKLPPVDRISARFDHSCAILAHPCASTGGRVMCWGNNGVGQLGAGDTTASSFPRSVRAP